ncbi:methyltransferase domain-containing protein [Patescibacteria group bacterium]|nr:methyltransferase domain-containing protein [Patescibacteria group bacterium]
MRIKYSDPQAQYGTARNLLNRELAWDRYGVGAGKYGIDFIHFEGDELVLDAGSGTGRDVAIITQRLNKGGKVFAVDISQALLSITCQRACNTISTPLCAIASIENLPFGDDQFDVVVAKHVLNHVDDLEHGLRESLRVVRKKGKVIITTGVKTPDDDLLRVCHQEAISRVGIETNVRLSRSPFHCGNAREYLDNLFGDVRYHFYGFQMVFPDVDSFMLYYTTLPSFQEATSDAATKSALAAEMRNLLSSRELPIVLDRSRGTFVCTKT